MDYASYPAETVQDIVRLRRRIAASGLPPRSTDHNLIVGTWNVRAFGRLYPRWDENPDSPKRNLRGLACIAEVVRRFDVIAIQEVLRDTEAIRTLVAEFLGPSWRVILSDATAGDAGNNERLVFIYDSRRVAPTGLAGEIVLPKTAQGDPQAQFARTPYIVGFESAGERFSLLTAHIDYGVTTSGAAVDADRLRELRQLADYTATEIRDRTNDVEAANLIVLGDFNIDVRGDNPLFQAFVSSGLVVPAPLLGIKTTFGADPKHYDQIAWFMGDHMSLRFSGSAGAVDFAGAVFQHLGQQAMTYRVSDHFPLWAEFLVDHSDQHMARTLSLDPHAPDPFAGVPD